MNTIFMNSENGKTSDLHVLLLNFSDNINLKRSNEYLALSNLSIYYTWKKKLKSHTKMINLKYHDSLHDDSFSVSDIQDFS